MAMSLQPGAKIGPYEILSLLGSGGMGEVYRGRDTRLERDVAIKILRVSASADPERIRRFEQEARATGLLNHPNILAIYDIGTHEELPYLVSELLEGETLRSRLQEGTVPQRKALDYAVQITQGLAAAHEKGIVHRDLKPENLFVTKDDRVKILDFGLAKLVQPENESSDHSKLATIQPQTESGIVLGTVGYMSPEQVRGKHADHRSDIFAFGAVLYEMLTGTRPFRGDSAVETMNAILKEEPPDMTQINPSISPSLESVVRRCLEKNPDLRFHSASDLGFALKEFAGFSSQSVKITAAVAPQSNRTPWILAAMMTFVAIAAVLSGIKTTKPSASEAQLEQSAAFKRLTFRRGNILHARFAPDGKTVVYGASWEGKPTEVFLTSPGNPESRPLGIEKADVLSVNSNGELAILLRSGLLQATAGTGTLASVSLTGVGAPRKLAEDVYDADWLPDNSGIVALRYMNGKYQLEFPLGTVVYETEEEIFGIRVSPTGDRTLLLSYSGDTDSIITIDRAGKRTTLKDGLNALDIASWSHDGKSIWFTAEMNDRYGLYSMDPDGKILTFIPLITSTVLHDISPDGNLLLEQEVFQFGIRFVDLKNGQERDISWLDGSRLDDLSRDGTMVLLSEERQGGGKNGTIYLRDTGGSPAVKLADGKGRALSPDKKWILAKLPENRNQLILVPTGPGSPIVLTPKNLDCGFGTWSSDGQTIVVQCNEQNQPPRLYRMQAGNPKMEPIGMPGNIETGAISPDGAFALLRIDGKFKVYPENNSTFPFLSTLNERDKVIITWNKDAIYTWDYREYPPQIHRIDTTTGLREVWKKIIPGDLTIIRIDDILMTPDARYYAYGYARMLSSDLYLMTRSGN